MNIIKPGADNLVLTTSLFDMIIFMDERSGKSRKRHAIVHKRRSQVYEDQWTDAGGHPISIVSEQVFNDIKDVLASTARQIQDLKRDVDSYKTQCEAYKTSIDALRKNGVID
jgi:hypothetical protein